MLKSMFFSVFLLLFFSNTIILSKGEYGVPKYLQNKYGGSLNSGPASPYAGTKTASKTKTKTHIKQGQGQLSGSAFSGHPPSGGCSTPPPTPIRAGLVCSAYGGCRATCSPNHQFPNGLTQLMILCQNGKWEIQETEWETAPACEPICLPPCQNSGICMAPNQCNCPENFSGPQCQYENRPCLNYPPMPRNSRRSCNSKTCTITCMAGHEFPDGSSIANMICKNGFWVPAKEKFSSIPDCQATCSPPCQNGGNCLSFNMCQCPQDFRGPQCQFKSEDCHARKLGFNGGYNCSGDSESFSCSLSCPEGVNFDIAPAPFYTCTYSTGLYLPRPIPQCVFPDNLEVIQGGGSSHTYYNMINGSDFNLNSLSINGLSKQNSYSQQFQQPLENQDLSNFGYVPLNQIGTNEDNLVFVEQKLPTPGVCFTWQGTHFKTFDGKVFSFSSKCAHILTRDAIDNTFSIVVKNSDLCYTNNQELCSSIISIFYQTKEYTLQQSPEGNPVFKNTKKTLPIPGQFPGLRSELSAHYIVISLDTIGVKVKWDGKLLVQVEVKENLWNRTEGLCGRFDGEENTDFLEKNGQKATTVSNLAVSWKLQELEIECNDLPQSDHSCQSNSIKSVEALNFCNKLLQDVRFKPCHRVLEINTLLDACRWDYCSCQAENPSSCSCETMNVYVRTCSFNGVKDLANWRDQNTCPMECSNGRVYKSCGPPTGQPVCGSTTEEPEDEQNCVEGCYCPEGTVFHENSCILREQCPCKLRGKSFVSGSQVPKDCNTCTCSEGQWVCTQISCGARCSAVGDPHYATFDGKKYDFMGQCSYYLIKTPSFSVEAENVACAGSISQAMNLPASVSDGLPSCTKAVTIRIENSIIKLKQNHEVVVNGEDVSKIPYQIGNVQIRSVSSLFLTVELPNGVELLWDGLTRVYIDIPPNFSEKTKGLCGSFNNNQKDDFLTPEGDIEQSVIPFANKWKTSEKCNDIPDKLKSDPCLSNIHKKTTAEEHCKKLKSDLFAPCHFFVDPEQFYQDCMFDMCSCEFKISKCLCPTVAAYASECARQGIKIDWRNSVRECGIHCPGGQKYQICGNSCTRTCQDVSAKKNCRPKCVEGCNCPEGEVMDESGECIPLSKCKCYQDGMEFYPGYKEVRPASKYPELCTCTNANWECRPASPEEVKDYPKASDMKSLCSAQENLEFTTCEPVEPVTCKNMHDPDFFTASICHAGCQCKKGYVLDSSSRKCVKPTECPCHHGGKSYKENSTVQADCNTCKCKNGKWECSENPCSAECSAWGDSHFKTFDGKLFDYQGQCDYALAKASLGANSFDISIQNVPCGSLGTSCSKSITIRIKSGGDLETISLTKDKPLPNYQNLKHVIIRLKGLFVIVEALDLGLVIQWDRGTRVYVKVDPRWKNAVKGLCGNYNDNDGDDFQTPSGGITEASAKIFGDSWKLQPYCPEALDIIDTCEDRPDRKVWALKQCGVLKSSLFSACHSEVPIDHYLEKCVFDSCACDQGGDCECLCTALAAYAQECNNHGVAIKWRSQKLCPMQCDERCSSYSPCISTCTTETCENLLSPEVTRICKEETCIEGCSPKPCPPGQIYLNSSYLECVPRNICKPICLEIDDEVFYEGDKVEEDACHTCFCSRGHKVCKGHPCTTFPPLVTTQHQLEQNVQCRTGWTEWINQDKAANTKTKTRGKKTDIEPLPNSLLLNNIKGGKCDTEKISKIECRTVRGHLAPKATGLDVECSLERGLICKSSGMKGRLCRDFEIRVFCDCEPQTTPAPICDPTQPHKEHPTDCHKFFHCDITSNGAEYVEKTCGPSMYYNPVSMTCDWPYAVVEIKPECKIFTTTPEPAMLEDLLEVLPPECPPGFVKETCGIKCDQLCLYYKYVLREEGKCLNYDSNCDSSCVSAEKRLSCPRGMFWANNETCVSLHDCSCTSSDNKPVKPGVVYRESDCKVCQCIDNFYTCDDSACHTTTEKPVTRVQLLGNHEIPIIPLVLSTVTPPEDCNRDNFIDLIQGDQPLLDEAFNASSILSPSFKPHFAKLNAKVTAQSGGSWSPEYSDIDQYLDIDLGRQEPIYGVKIKGSPLYNEYVTSFKVFYSPDSSKNFLPVLNSQRLPQIFRGSIDTNSVVEVIFEVPFEAEIVRINPQTWHNGISLRVELIGCGEAKSTTADEVEWITLAPTTPKPKLCEEEPMGLSNGLMSLQQIEVSSELDKEHGKRMLNISGNDVWQPLTNSPTEFVQFDFLEPRSIVGVVTKGGEKGWVSAYVIKYSHDGTSWNQIIEKKTMKEQVFPGNYDSNTAQKNEFELPISTKLLRVVPTKWYNDIQMRVEILGCYKPYPEIEEVMTTAAPSACNRCPGVDYEPLELHACRCTEEKWWDGQNCVSRTECPCMVGHIPYFVGTLFEKEDCSECLCKLGGTEHCNQKKCTPCEEGMRSAVTATCKCTCQPCPENTILCPTSNICINSTLWCNGVQDCPDDEVDCVVATSAPEKTTTKKPEKKCPIVECPPGYKKELREVNKATKHRSTYLSPMFKNSGRKNTKSQPKTSYNIKTKIPNRKPLKFLQKPSKEVVHEEMICPEYRCRSQKPPPKFTDYNQCSVVGCPPGYIQIFDEEDSENLIGNNCPKYTCYIPPPEDAVCTIIAKTFNTFDGIEYKYDICNHILARDLQNDEWDISLKKSCGKTCTRLLVINHNKNTLVLYPDQTIEFDGFNYTIDQTKKIGSQTQAFSLQNLGNVLLFISNRYGFWIIWDKQGNAKLGVVHKLSGEVDGLCGYFNEDSSDDKRKPDGNQARTSTEFGDSWAQSDEVCDSRTCPLDVQNKAWEMCNQVKDQVFANCVKNVDIEAFISRCLETTCECLQKSASNHTAEEECRCGTLQNFVVDCLAKAPSTDLSEWRMQMDCPVLCDSPLVYHDCYQRKCEPTCESISDSNLCPKLPQVCFPGCYCPAGYVKKGETCIKPSSCRDCECNVLPHLQYITYDNSNFTVNGNCVYVMSRDVLLDNENKHKFQVLITNAPCRTNEEKTCVGKVTILYEGHKIHVLHDLLRNKLRLVVDGERIDDIEEQLSWGTLRETSTKHYKILLTSAQVEVSVYFPSLGVSVKAPSHKYAGKLEGLCGDCNKDPSNDLQKPNTELVKDTNEFAVSWLYDKLPGGQNAEMCQNKPKETCVEIAEELDPCLQILDANKFGQCLRILDPSLFLEWCKKDTCGNHPELSCTAIEAFARDCASAGFCVNWRNSLCPAKECASDQVYNACGSPCPQTCENKDKNKVCRSKMGVEGCFCPEGKIFRNQTCVLPEDCEVCDEEGHHPGEHWKKDKCTNCRCEGVSLKCETQQCSGSEQICQKGFQAVRIPGAQDECCDKYACLPEPTMGPTCEPPQKIDCGQGQVLKLDTKPNGCQQFICECKPLEECDLIEPTQSPLEEGYERILDDSGCCPVLKLICNKQLCPKPKPCEQYYTLNNETSSSKCCPFYSCLPPKDQCIHSAEFTASEEGGERQRTLLEKQKLLKNANETWKDGPCRECKCLLSSLGNYQESCSQTDCSALEISQDFLEYELEPVFVYGQCCPIVQRTACKVNGKLYSVGETWTKENDFCTTFECSNSTESGVQKEKHVQSCDTSCEQGFEYIPAEKSSKQCCGSCKPYACVVDGQIYKVGEEWHSEDFCTNYFCLNMNGSMQVQSVWVNCPELPQDYIENYIYETIPVEGECCKKHNTRACKVNGKPYKINETWPSPDGDKCKTISCIQNQHNEIQKQESLQTCKKECAKGWEYQDSDKKCCGECIQTACVVDNTLKAPNENWTSPDNCTTFTCEVLNDGQFVVSSQQESCPGLEDCPEENIYEKGCCKHCNLTASSQELCSPQAMPLKKTVGVIKSHHGGTHGNCTNKEEIDGFTECVGSCHSSTFFNLKSGAHESVCSCCKVVDYASVEVELVCEDGYRMKKKVTVPSECGCQGCSAPKFTKNTKH